MATMKGSFNRAVVAHREALGLVRAARDALERLPQESLYSAESVARQAGLVQQLQEAAGALTSGWGTAPWEWLAGGRRPVAQRADRARETLTRIGAAHPISEGFPVLVPFLGAGHLCVDADARDARVSGLIRGVLLRLLADAPVGSVRVLAVDADPGGETFTPLLPLVDVELMNTPVTDAEGLRRVFTDAEDHVRRVQEAADRQTVVVAIATFPVGCSVGDYARLAALSHAGHRSGVQLIVAGYPPAGGYPSTAGTGPLGVPGAHGVPGAAGASGGSVAGGPALENTTRIRSRGQFFHVGDLAGQVLSTGGRGLSSPVQLDAGPPDGLIRAVCRQLAGRVAEERTVDVLGLVPQELWTESSVDGLRTIVGRSDREPGWLSLDDATPHWLLAGRTGSGKTVLLHLVLYGLAARYGPDELALYLLDLGEGGSFTGFAPTAADSTWVPHVRTVGVESDREYGVAVLAALATETSRRATQLKQAGVTRLAQLRQTRRDLALPRVVAVIDACDVLIGGDDVTARQARALLEDIARRGRAHGVHLILSSQVTAGLQDLLADHGALFGQFTRRIALAGGGAALDRADPAEATLPPGVAIIEDLTGAARGHRQVRFPDTHPESVRRLRARMWQQQIPGDQPPAVFAGSAPQHIEDDPTLARLGPGVRRRVMLVGRAVEVGLPTATFPLDTSPGRHLAVLGPGEVGADILHAAVVGLARQHEPGTAEFVLAGLVAVADEAADVAAAVVRSAGHRCSEVELTGLREVLGRLARPQPDESDVVAALHAGAGDRRPQATYVVVWGADGASAALRSAIDPATGASGLDDLREVLQDGPSRGVHLLTWWRGVRRFREDLGPAGRDDVAGLVALNVSGADLADLVGHDLPWQPRPNRALLVDRHVDRATLFIPFVRPDSVVRLDRAQGSSL